LILNGNASKSCSCIAPQGSPDVPGAPETGITIANDQELSMGGLLMKCIKVIPMGKIPKAC
jgi:hypothetical protein